MMVPVALSRVSSPDGRHDEDARRAVLLQEIVVTPPETRQGDFSYGAS